MPIKWNSARLKSSIFLLVCGLFVVGTTTALFAGRSHLNDFHSFYVGSHLFWAGGDLYDTAGAFTSKANELKLDFLIGTGYSYPPMLAFLLWPLTLVSFTAASQIWVTFSLLLYSGMMAFVLYRLRRLPLPVFTLLTLFVFTYLPIEFTLVNGQANIFLLGLIGGYFYWSNSRPNLAALALTLAAYLKVYPALFFGKEILFGQWKKILIGLVFTAGITIPILLASDLSLFTKYLFEFLPSLNGSPDHYYSNQSLNGFISRVLAKAGGGYVVQTEQFKIGMTALTLIILAVLAGWSRRHNPRDMRLQLLWLAIMTLLAGKNSFWNFAPAVLIGIYLIAHFHLLRRFERALIILSISISNYLWVFVWPINNEYTYSTWGLSKVLYATLGSLGFFSLLLTALVVLLWLSRQPTLSSQRPTQSST